MSNPWHRRIWRGLATACAVLMLPAGPLPAQQAASLVADSVTLAGQVLTARGNVTAFADGTRLSAAEIRYDGASRQLTIIGPIVLTDAQTGAVMTATQAQLSEGLRSGLLLGARLVLDQRLQLAAARADRDGARTQLTGVAVTSCQVCPGRAPLWSIRAGRVMHDADAQRLWFDDAQFRLRGVPIVTVPRLSLPDPGTTRATGLLRPVFSRSAGLGTAVRLPYFLALSETRDLTVTPVLAQKALSAEFRLRQALPGGGATLNAMLGHNGSGATRAYLLGDASAALPLGWRLDAQIEALSDAQVLADYGLDRRDRLLSALAFTRIQARRMDLIRLAHYTPLTTGENPQTAPMNTVYAITQGRRALGGGLLGWELSADAHAPDAPGSATGRLGIGGDYSRRWIFGPGVEAHTSAALRYDLYEGTGPHGTVSGRVALLWPLMRRTGDVTHVIEPQLALAYLAQHGAAPVNHDSTRLAFDETTLFAHHPASGQDLALPGASASASLAWTMQAAGARTRLSAGRLLRDSAPAGVATSTGLSTARSDWLIGAEADFAWGLRAAALGVLGEDGAARRSESRLGWQSERLQLDARHLFLTADAAENRNADVSLVGLDAAWQASPDWHLTGAARYDIAADAPISAKLGAEWRNECVRVGISASHSFATSSNVTPTTDFGLEFSIDGFSASQTGLRPARSCPPT